MNNWGSQARLLACQTKKINNRSQICQPKKYNNRSQTCQPNKGNHTTQICQPNKSNHKTQICQTINHLFDGFNCVLLCLDDDPINLRQLIQTLFEDKPKLNGDLQDITVSCIQIQNNKLKDLLATDGAKNNVEILQDPNGNLVLKNASNFQVQTYSNILHLLKTIEKRMLNNNYMIIFELKLRKFIGGKFKYQNNCLKFIKLLNDHKDIDVSNFINTLRMYFGSKTKNACFFRNYKLDRILKNVVLGKEQCLILHPTKDNNSNLKIGELLSKIVKTNYEPNEYVEITNLNDSIENFNQLVEQLNKQNIELRKENENLKQDLKQFKNLVPEVLIKDTNQTTKENKKGKPSNKITLFDDCENITCLHEHELNLIKKKTLELQDTIKQSLQTFKEVTSSYTNIVQKNVGHWQFYFTEGVQTEVDNFIKNLDSQMNQLNVNKENISKNENDIANEVLDSENQFEKQILRDFDASIGKLVK